MCVSILFYKFNKDYPIILGNNRDEMINRKFSSPTILNSNPLIFGPKDLERGGTWLGVNQYKVLVNILNKWTGKKNFFGNNQNPSRGLLVLELLKFDSVKNIINEIRSINLDEYLPFQLLLVDKHNAFILIKDNDLEIIDITDKKIFVIGNIHPLENWEKYNFAYNFLKNQNLKDLKSIFESLEKLLKIHKGDKNIPSLDFAVKQGEFQTTSSSLIAINSNLIFKFIKGFPVNKSYKDYLIPLSV